MVTGPLRSFAPQVGTSSVVYPAAMFAPRVSARGVPVAELNMETTPATDRFRYGAPRAGGVGTKQVWTRPSKQMLPAALAL